MKALIFKPNAEILWMMSKPAPGNRAVIALPVAAFALVSALLLIVLAGALSFYTHPFPEDGEGTAAIYQILSLFALCLLIFPLFTLGGSAARLSARRRDERLSTLRLMGATPRLVGTLTVVESTVVAAVGVVFGIVLYVVLLPLIALIPFQGEPRGIAALWLSPLVVLGACLALVILAAVSAMIGLRQVVLSPLGVRTRATAPTTHWVRALIAVGGAVILFVCMNMLGIAGSLMLLVIFVVLIGGLALLNVIGPYLLKIRTQRWLRKAQTPEKLLASRTILESPKAAWRQVSSLSLTSFIAVIAGVGVGLMAGFDDDPHSANALLAADMRTGVIITVVASFLLVACSAGVNQAAAILDRADLYVSLDRLGMPVSVMDSARKRAVLWPVATVTIASALLAAVLIFPLTGITILIDPLTLLSIAGILAGGIALVWAGLAATSGVLRHVVSNAH